MPWIGVDRLIYESSVWSHRNKPEVVETSITDVTRRATDTFVIQVDYFSLCTMSWRRSLRISLYTPTLQHVSLSANGHIGCIVPTLIAFQYPQAKAAGWNVRYILMLLKWKQGYLSSVWSLVVRENKRCSGSGVDATMAACVRTLMMSGYWDVARQESDGEPPLISRLSSRIPCFQMRHVIRAVTRANVHVVG